MGRYVFKNPALGNFVIDWTGPTSTFGPLWTPLDSFTRLEMVSRISPVRKLEHARIYNSVQTSHVPAPAKVYKRALSVFSPTTPTSVTEQQSPPRALVPYLHTKPTTLERDPRFHRLLPRLQTAASAHHNQAPKWTPKRALTFSRSTKCTYARHGWPRTALSPALGVLAAPRLLNSTQSAADRASPSSSLSGTTGSTAAFTNNATKAELD